MIPTLSNSTVSAVASDHSRQLSQCEGTAELHGDVAVSFQIDATGLTDAWILEHSDVPFGPLTCFSAAVYGVDWSGVSSTPAEVSLVFTLDAPAP